MLSIQIALWLEVTCLLTTVFIGSPQWVIPTALCAFVAHGFWIETGLALCMSGWITLSLIGLLKTGFSRYLSLVSTTILFSLLGLFLLGYFVFSWIYLDQFYGFEDLTNLFWQRYQEPILWHQFIQTECISLATVIVGVVVVLFERLRPSRKALGKAHFSNGFETHQAGFFKREEQSILIGKKYGAPLYSNGFEHVLVFAPTGSGKTRSIGIPNLFHYPYSVVCNDVKLTMFNTTSGFRETVLGHSCYCWAPASEDRKTHRYNPLSLISEDKTQRLTDIQRIAHILIPDSKKSDPIWQQASRKLFKVA